jgi:hypothetical protein
MSTVSLNAFTSATQNTDAQDAALRVTWTGQVQKSSGLHELFATKTAHRKTTVQFLSALKARYGDQIANLAAHDLPGAISAGKPLTARTIKAVVSEAECITASLAAFLSGADSSGKPIEHNLDKAVEAWETAYPKEAARMTPEERQTVKERIAKELMAGNPVCHSPKEMFQAVLNKDLRPPISGNITLPSALTGVAAVQARAAAEEDVTRYMGGRPGTELFRNLTGAKQTFQKDLARNTNVILEGHRVATKADMDAQADDLPSSLKYPSSLKHPLSEQEQELALAANGRDEIAHFLTGQEGVCFADLTETQQKQVQLLSGLCSQELEVPAVAAALEGLIDLRQGSVTTSSAGASRAIQLRKDNEGNFEVRFDASLPAATVPDKSDETGMRDIDSNSSHLDIHIKLVISPGELERLANLDWTNFSEKNTPEEYMMHFEKGELSSSLTLNELPGGKK